MHGYLIQLLIFYNYIYNSLNEIIVYMKELCVLSNSCNVIIVFSLNVNFTNFQNDVFPNSESTALG